LFNELPHPDLRQEIAGAQPLSLAHREALLEEQRQAGVLQFLFQLLDLFLAKHNRGEAGERILALVLATQGFGLTEQEASADQPPGRSVRHRHRMHGTATASTR
jgi:hypothetical protein